MNGKIYLGWVALPMLVLSIGNSFFFYTQLLKNNRVNSTTKQPNNLSSWQIAARSDNEIECLRSGNCKN